MIKKLFITLIILMLSTPAHAGWVDDWLQQHTAHSPGYFEGQSRGYMTGGSFSARWQRGTDYLFTIESPRIKTGCAGLDILFGGFSFLNFDYLVKKLQRILAAAPAAAFDIALSTLCEKCSSTIKSMESIVNALNSLQLDDCAAARVVAAEVLSPFHPRLAAKRQEIEKDFLASSGFSNFLYAISEKHQQSGGKQQASDREKLAGCPQGLKDIFLTPGRTVLAALGEKRGYPSQYMDLARGFIGDVSIRFATADGVDVIIPYPISPCSKNNPRAVEDFITGEAEAKNTDGTCYKITDVNANLQKWAEKKLRSIAAKIKNRSGLSPEERNFLDVMPMSPLPAIKAAVNTGVESSIIGPLSVIASRAYAYGMMSDLYNKVLENLYAAEELIAKQGQKDTKNCQIGLLTSAINRTQEMIPKVREIMLALKSEYSRVATEVNTIQNIVSNYQKFDSIARGSLSKIFGISVAERALTGRN